MRDVTKTYDGQTEVLHGVTLAVEPGDAILISGENGSGKTTLLNVAGLLDVPTKGQVLVDGKDAGRLKEAARANVRLRTIGFMFQDHNLIEDLTTLQNVMLPMRLARAKKREEAARNLLEMFGLGKFADRKPMELSTGQRQLAAVARALANGPRVVLADEPTASLDAANAALVIEALRGANLERGVAVVFAYHDSEIRWPGARRRRLQDGVLAPV
ncbi:MAG: ABC transporter ATP-binding protein [Euryarchaeota archaeon]|nr:ABC transporter ATP-binding protein [Euryarchaeota archaeon]